MEYSPVFRQSIVGGFSSALPEPNAGGEPRPEAEAQRKLLGVGSSAGLGAEDGRDTVRTRPLHGPEASHSSPLTPS